MNDKWYLLWWCAKYDAKLIITDFSYKIKKKKESSITTVVPISSSLFT